MKSEQHSCFRTLHQGFSNGRFLRTSQYCIFLQLLPLTKFGEECKLYSYVTSCLLSRNTLLSNLLYFLHTCSSSRMRAYVSHACIPKGYNHSYNLTISERRLSRPAISLGHICIIRSLYYRVLQKEFYNGIQSVTKWRVLRKRLHLKAYKLDVLNDG
jgi:hypothetical protein